MDELDLLKKGWNSQTQHKKLSAADIYPMLHKKSSSIVKTLFYISIAELIFWVLVNTIPLLSSDAYNKAVNDIYGSDGVFFTGLTIFTYAVILLFVYLLYKSYQSISVTANAKKLMESIIKTRKIVKYYVLYNLIMAGIAMLSGLYFAFQHNPKLNEQVMHFSQKEFWIVCGISISITAAFILFIWLFYKLIYGFLLKRLNHNYKELKRLES